VDVRMAEVAAPFSVNFCARRALLAIFPMRMIRREAGLGWCSSYSSFEPTFKMSSEPKYHNFATVIWFVVRVPAVRISKWLRMGGKKPVERN
jgi:hypothetical protein